MEAPDPEVDVALGGRALVRDRPAEVEFELRPPPGAVPGTYWMLVEAACQGRIAYGPAIAVRVSGVPDVPQG
ncbi:hypothetical protein [Streptomyces sp. KS 21]|uniref:hypothetical protein n=1 Tax=Streptomyces sp. KS 21 TaxID=2485150 RepID=UPI001415112A|nr:hypothetical protein [Streptomyces sp. KS 21]